jgi:DNA-binding LacI/PurR family transcriptional regulator
MIGVPEDTRAHGHETLRGHAGTFPDALFCENDELAVGCCRALAERGLRVPDDVAVVGCDGIDEAAFLQPPLTTIVQPVDEMCRLGWEFLKRRIADRDAERRHAVLPARLEVRASHG